MVLAMVACIFLKDGSVKQTNIVDVHKRDDNAWRAFTVLRM